MQSRMKKIFLLFVAIAFISVLQIHSAFADKAANKAYDGARRCYSVLEKDAAKRENRSNWDSCSKMFENVSMDFPKDKRAPDALLSAAKLRRETYDKFGHPGDVEEAIRLYNRIVKEYPTSSLADDALYNIAVLRHKPLGQDDKAIIALSYLLENFGEGDMAPKAKALLSSIGEGSQPSEEGGISAPGESKPAEEASKARPEVVGAASATKPEAEGAVSAKSSGPFDIATLTRIDVSEVDGSTQVALTLSKSVPYSVEFTEQGPRTRTPPKLDLVLTRTRLADTIPKEMSIHSANLESLRIKKRLLESGSILIFQMASDTAYNITPKANQIVITFKGSRGAAPPQAVPAKGPKEDDQLKEDAEASGKKKSGT